MDEKDYLSVNKATWNNKVEYHIKSDFYDLEGFLLGKTSLKDIELKILGDIKGKSILHLQCHFGQDTISLQRMGANVTGVDFSDEAITKAKKLNDQLDLNTNFVCSDVYDLPNHLNKKFDVVFTSYGVIGRLPDIDKWAGVVESFLKPSGRFVMVEFHPVVWMFDDDFKSIVYRYFNGDAIHEVEEGTYADVEAPISQNSITWNHGIGEVVSSLLKRKLSLKHFEEYDYSPYNCFAHTDRVDTDKYRIKHLEDRIPMTYSIEAIKK